MTRNKKILTWVLVISSSVLLIVIALAAWVIYSFFAKLSAYRTETPPELREARVIAGADFLSRNQFVTIDQSWASLDDVLGLGSIRDIATGELDSKPGLDIAIAGRYGAMIVDQNGTKQSEIRYEFESKIFFFTSQSANTILGESRSLILRATAPVSI